jgi:hypothetical protein
MGRFCEELNVLYGIEYQDLWTLADAESYLRDGWGLLAGMSGSVYEGGKSCGAHVLYVWRCDSSGVYISYFYAIRKGQA